MLADIHTLYISDVYRVVDFRCHCNVCSLSKPEYNESLCVSFVRKGFFEYNTFRRKDEAHVGRILISKPFHEHTTRHIDNQPDITSVYEFRAEFMKEILKQYSKDAGWFLSNNDIHSVLLQSNPETEYIHNHIMQLINHGYTDSLQIDEMVFMLLDKVISILGNIKAVPSLHSNLKKYHLATIESARDYLLQHFKENVSLQQLAQHCHVSPFHFSRIFKTFLQTSPHQYLAEIRLNHARVLLSTTNRTITEIAFDCGFNSLEHFATAYRQRFKISPSAHRRQLA